MSLSTKTLWQVCELCVQDKISEHVQLGYRDSSYFLKLFSL